MNFPPTDWDNVAVEDFGQIVAGGTPSRATPSYWNGSIPWATPSEITSLQGKFVRDTREKITADGLAGSAARLLPTGSVLVTTRATLGETAIAAVPLTTNQGFKNIVPNGDTDCLFAYYRIQTLKSEMVRLASGTTFLEISKADFARIRTRRPKRSEQARIGAVLDTVDEAIAKAEAVIAKLKQLRAGLLHDLLTRGLDEHGQLRDPIEHPEQFQDSPLGRIPREWSVRKLADCYQIASRNGLYKKATCYGSGHRMIHMPQMFKGIIIDASEAARVTVDLQELERYGLEEGDILFARRSLNLEGAGLSSLVPHLEEPVTFESSIVRVRVNRDLVVPRFGAEFFRSPRGYSLRRRFIRQVAVSGVSGEDIGHFILPCPDPGEQRRIIATLATQDAALLLLESELAKLDLIKSGLMTDLLTGRVRVPVDIGG
jgi:type I restriction enzyme S subunit